MRISTVLARCLRVALISCSAGSSMALAQTAEERDTPETAPAPAIQTQYRQVVDLAVAEFDAGRVAEARALFLRAHELWPSARTFRTLGMTAFELRMYPRALRELQHALDDPNRPLPPNLRQEVTVLTDRAKSYVGRYELQVDPTKAELLVDGGREPTSEPLLLGVGVHQLVVRSAHYAELRRELIVQGREDEVLELRLQPLPILASPTPPTGVDTPPTAPEKPSDPGAAYRHGSFVAFGVAGLGLAVGAVSGMIALSKKHDVRDLEAGHRAADISTAGFIVTGAGALAGALLLLFAPEAAPVDPARTAVAFNFGLGSIALTGAM